MQIYKKNLKFHIIMGVIFFYLGYILGNFYTHLQGYDFYSKFISLTTKDMLKFILDNPIDIFLNPSFIGLFIGYMALLATLLIYTKDNDKGVYRKGEEHGSARYATVKEIQRFADTDLDKNIIYTRYARMGLYSHRLAYENQKNKNGLVIGGPGSGKTFTFVKPNIMQMNSSFLVIDPKGLLIRETGQMLADNDYNIKIFDLENLLNSDLFNIFDYIKTELDIDRVLEFITEGTKKIAEKGTDDFWRQAEALLVRSFIAFLWFDGQKNEYTPHLGMIADMLRLTKRRDPDVPSPVEEWFIELENELPNNYACKQWSLFHELFDGETRMSALAIAAGRYSIFDHEQVTDMIRHDTMDIESWLYKKTAVFVSIPETSDSYNFLASIFISTVMETLRKKKDSILTGLSESKGEIEHFRYYLDEYANGIRIPNVEKAMATLRSRDMSIVLIIQAIDQLKTMHRHGWATLINLCDSLLFLGGDEKETVDYLSKRAGKQTISVRKSNIQKSGRGGSSENRDSIGRDLIMPDEIGRINGTDALLFISGEFVFKDKKYTVSDHKNAHLLANSPSDDNWYHYKRYKDEIDELLDKINPENVVNHGIISNEVKEAS